jgi:hypothetical protein
VGGGEETEKQAVIVHGGYGYVVWTDRDSGSRRTANVKWAQAGERDWDWVCDGCAQCVVLVCWCVGVLVCWCAGVLAVMLAVVLAVMLAEPLRSDGQAARER